MERHVSYLVRVEDPDATTLQLFTYDPKYDVPAQGELVAYLTSIIELNRYDTGPAVAGIWRWDGDDSLHVLRLDLKDIVPELDGWQDERWEIINPAARDEIIPFTVAIDTRGQQ
jgi:hypothetical protein